MAKLQDWQPDDWRGEKLKQRTYKNYAEYKEHQSEAFRKKYAPIMARFDKDTERFKSNFEDVWLLTKDPLRCLCIGARSGAEVKALIDLGHNAIGIDLEPGVDNPYVKAGDMHNLKFEDKSFDVVYSNVFDHVYDLEKALSEVKRVLKNNGHFILEAVDGYEEGGWPGDHEAAYWPTTDAFFNVVKSHGFAQIIPPQKVQNVKGLGFKRAILQSQ